MHGGTSSVIKLPYYRSDPISVSSVAHAAIFAGQIAPGERDVFVANEEVEIKINLSVEG